MSGFLSRLAHKAGCTLIGFYLALRQALRRLIPFQTRRRFVQRLRRRGTFQRGPAPDAPALAAGVAWGAPHGYDVLCFPIIDWDFRFQRPQQLVTQFAQAGRRCFYLSTTFYGRGQAALVTALDEAVYGVQLPGSERLDLYRAALSAAQVEAALAALGGLRRAAGLANVVCLVQLPFWAPLALAARERWGWPVVYDCLDEHSGFGTLAPPLLAAEPRLIANSDLVLATSRQLYDRVAPLARQALLLPNAADFEHFHQPATAAPLAHLAGPVIGYYGAIAQWFDVDLLHAAALARPQWHFVLIGHTQGARVDALRRRPNVHLLGEQPYAALPTYLARFDVACIPFKLNPLTRATNPVKFYEYLSAGKPVVATPLPELEPYAGLYYPAASAEAFVAQCEAALREDSPERRAARLACARENTWAHRHQALAAALPALLGGKEA